MWSFFACFWRFLRFDQSTSQLKLGSIGVMISASMALIWPPDEHPWVSYIDPSLSVGLGILILFTSLPLGNYNFQKW